MTKNKNSAYNEYKGTVKNGDRVVNDYTKKLNDIEEKFNNGKDNKYTDPQNDTDYGNIENAERGHKMLVRENSGMSGDLEGDVSIGGMKSTTGYQWKTNGGDTTKANNIKHKQLIRNIFKGHAATIGELTKSNATLDKIHNFQQSVQGSYYKTSLENQFKMIAELQAIKNALFIGFDIDPQTGRKSEEEGEKEEEKSLLSKIFGRDGFGGIKEGLGALKDNALTKSAEWIKDKIPGAEYIDTIKALDKDEIGTLITSSLKTMLKELFVGQLKQRTTTTQYNWITDPDTAMRQEVAKGRLGGLGKLLGNFGMSTQTAADILGVKTGKISVERGVSEDEARVEFLKKSNAAFDGKAHYALTTVIPELLSMQLAVLSGNGGNRLVMDYTTGKFTSIKDIEKKNDARVHSKRYISSIKSLYKTYETATDSKGKESGGLLGQIEDDIESTIKNNELDEDVKKLGEQILNLFKTYRKNGGYKSINIAFIEFFRDIREYDVHAGSETADGKRISLGNYFTSFLSAVKTNDIIQIAEEISARLQSVKGLEGLNAQGRFNIARTIAMVCKFYAATADDMIHNTLSDVYSTFMNLLDPETIKENNEIARQSKTKGTISSYTGGLNSNYFNNNRSFLNGQFGFGGMLTFLKNGGFGGGNFGGGGDGGNPLYTFGTPKTVDPITGIRLETDNYGDEFNNYDMQNYEVNYSGAINLLQDKRIRMFFELSRQKKVKYAWILGALVAHGKIYVQQKEEKDAAKSKTKYFYRIEYNYNANFSGNASIDKANPNLTIFRGYLETVDEKGKIVPRKTDTANFTITMLDITPEQIEKVINELDQKHKVNIQNLADMEEEKTVLGLHSDMVASNKNITEILKRYIGNYQILDNDYERQLKEKESKFGGDDTEFVNKNAKEDTDSNNDYILSQVKKFQTKRLGSNVAHFEELKKSLDEAESNGADKKTLNKMFKAGLNKIKKMTGQDIESLQKKYDEYINNKNSYLNTDFLIEQYKSDESIRSKIDSEVSDASDPGFGSLRNRVIDAATKGRMDSEMLYHLSQMPGFNTKDEKALKWALSGGSTLAGLALGDSGFTTAVKTGLFRLTGQAAVDLLKVKEAFSNTNSDGTKKTAAEAERDRYKLNEDMATKLMGNNIGSAAGAYVHKFLKNNIAFGGPLGFVANLMVSSAVGAIAPYLFKGGRSIAGWLSKKILGHDITGSDRAKELDEAAKKSREDLNNGETVSMAEETTSRNVDDDLKSKLNPNGEEKKDDESNGSGNLSGDISSNESPGQYGAIPQEVLNSQCAPESLSVLVQHMYNSKSGIGARMDKPINPLAFASLQQDYINSYGTNVRFFMKAFYNINKNGTAKYYEATGVPGISIVKTHLSEGWDGAILLISTDQRIRGKFSNHFVAIRKAGGDYHVFDGYSSQWEKGTNAWKYVDLDSLAPILKGVVLFSWGNVIKANAGSVTSGIEELFAKYSTDDEAESIEENDTEGGNLSRPKLTKLRNKALKRAYKRAHRFDDDDSVSGNIMVNVPAENALEYAKSLLQSPNKVDKRKGYALARYLRMSKWDDPAKAKLKAKDVKFGDKKGKDGEGDGKGKDGKEGEGKQSWFKSILSTIIGTKGVDSLMKKWKLVKAGAAGAARWGAGLAALSAAYGATRWATNKFITGPTQGLIAKGATALGMDEQTASENAEYSYNTINSRRNARLGMKVLSGLGAGAYYGFTNTIKPGSEEIGKLMTRGIIQSVDDAGVNAVKMAGRSGLVGAKGIFGALSRFENKIGEWIAKLGGKVGQWAAKLWKSHGKKIAQKFSIILGDIMASLSKTKLGRGAMRVGGGIFGKLKSVTQRLFSLGNITAILNAGFVMWALIRGWRNAYKVFGHPDNSYCTLAQKLASSITAGLLELAMSLPTLGVIIGTLISSIVAFIEPSIVRGIYELLQSLGVDSKYATNNKGYATLKPYEIENTVGQDNSAMKAPEDTGKINEDPYADSRLTPNEEVDYRNEAMKYARGEGGIYGDAPDSSPYNGNGLGIRGLNILSGKGTHKLKAKPKKDAKTLGKLSKLYSAVSSISHIGKETKEVALPLFVSQLEFSKIKLGGVNAVFNGCALACAKMIVEYYEKGITDSKLIQASTRYLKSDDKSITVTYFKAMKGKEFKPKNWLSRFIGSHDKMIVLLVAISKQDNHFITLFTRGNKYFLGDPMNKDWKEVSIEELKTLNVKYMSEFDKSTGLDMGVAPSILGGHGLWDSIKTGTKNFVNKLFGRTPTNSSKTTTTTPSQDGDKYNLYKPIGSDFDSDELTSAKGKALAYANKVSAGKYSNKTQAEVNQMMMNTRLDTGMANITAHLNAIKYGSGWKPTNKQEQAIFDRHSKEAKEDSKEMMTNMGGDGAANLVKIAKEELARHIVVPQGGDHNTGDDPSARRVRLYWASAANGKKGIDEKDIEKGYSSWCASFATFCLKKAGADLSRATGLRAGNFPAVNSSIFEKVSDPRPGDLMVWLPNGSNGSNHVAILVDITDKEYICIGGNQGVRGAAGMRGVTQAVYSKGNTMNSKRPLAGFYRCKTLHAIAGAGDNFNFSGLPDVPSDSFLRGLTFTKDATSNENALRYLNVMLPLAKKYKVHPRLAFGQWINESGWGKSKLATQGNNFFGVKAVKGRPSIMMPTAEYNAKGQRYMTNAPFVKFSTPQEGIEFQMGMWNRKYRKAAETGDARYLFKQYGAPDSYASASPESYVKLSTDHPAAIKLMQVLNSKQSGRAGFTRADIQTSVRKLYKLINANKKLRDIICGPYALGSLIVSSGILQPEEVIPILEHLVDKYNVSQKGFTIEMIHNLGFVPKSVSISGNRLSGLDKQKSYMIFGKSSGITHFISYNNINNTDYYYDNRSNNIADNNIDKNFVVSEVYEADIMSVIKMLTGGFKETTFSRAQTQIIANDVTAGNKNHQTTKFSKYNDPDKLIIPRVAGRASNVFSKSTSSSVTTTTVNNNADNLEKIAKSILEAVLAIRGLGQEQVEELKLVTSGIKDIGTSTNTQNINVEGNQPTGNPIQDLAGAFPKLVDSMSKWINNPYAI